MANYVPPQLPNSNFNKIFLVGEAPGVVEDTAKNPKPFIGRAGKLLDYMLKQAKIVRDECYVGNIARYRPENDDFRKLPKELVDEGLRELKADIERLQPNVIVPLGNIPLEYLCNLSKISNWRGSILPCSLVEGKKCIPTYHPAGIMREYENLVIAVKDLKRVREDAKFPELRLPVRSFKIRPTFDEVVEYMTWLCDTNEIVAFDIETGGPNNTLSCFGFSHDPSQAFCVPIVCEKGFYWTEREEAIIMKLLAKFCSSSKVKKAVQNMMFEGFMLGYHYGIQLNGVEYDTMLMFHASYPELAKNLGFITSIYTREPYYKYERRIDDWDTHYIYNCKDCAVTREVVEPLLNELTSMSTYQRELANGREAIKMSLWGIGYDSELAKSQLEKLEKRKKNIDFILNELVGYELNTSSPSQVKKLLYDEMELPPIIKKGKRGASDKVTVDEDALNELYYKTRNPILPLIILSRGCTTEKSFYNMTVDKRDGRIRVSHNPAGQEAARWSTSTNPLGVGRSLQNLPKPSPNNPVTPVCQFVADDGYIFLEWDYNQIEARLVAYFASCEKLIGLFESGEDIHRATASAIFGMKPEDIGKDSKERFLGKQTNHASNYGLGGTKLSKIIHKRSGIYVPPSECSRFIETYHNLYPEVRQIYQKNVREEVMRTRRLTNLQGRTRHFWGRMNDDLFREAYAYKPSSSTSDFVNTAINTIAESLPVVRFYVHTHDGLLTGVPEKDWLDLAKEMFKHFTFTFNINGRNFVTPVSCKYGKRWGALNELRLSD